MDGSNFAKWFIYAGLSLLIIGLLLWLANRFGLIFGKLPGDIHLHKEKFSFYFPIATSILISIALTLLINLILWLMRK